MHAPRLRIALLAPIAWRVPPRDYGPWEQVVSNLAEGLVARGVDVTLFASADSLTRGRLAAVCPHPVSEDKSLDPRAWECLHSAHCFERAGEFDIIHNHCGFVPLSHTGLVSTPVVTTIYNAVSPRVRPVYERYNGRTSYVAISEASRCPTLDYLATVYHGIRMADFKLDPTAEGYLLFFGRIHPERGCAEAISIAKRLRRRLVIAGVVQDEHYFAEEIEPQLDGVISYIGPVGPERRAEVLGGASAMLHLINFDEPFGMSVVEAMACGTPVVAMKRGSMPEVIESGMNGWLVTSVKEAEEALDKCTKLDRREVRASVEQRFDAGRMVEDYLRVYEQVLGVEGLAAHGAGEFAFAR